MGYWARRGKAFEKVLELCDEPIRSIRWREFWRCGRMARREKPNDKTVRASEHIDHVSIRPPELGLDVLTRREGIALRLGEVQPSDKWDEEFS
jgi:hypothetical protein